MQYSQVGSCARIKPILRVNDEFALVKIYAHGIGKNRNYSYISHAVAEEATPTLNYIPVIGHLIPKYDEDGNTIGYYMGSHDVEIDWDTWTIKSLTVPYGVVIEDSADWEMVDEYGTMVEYRTVYAYLWIGRYPELAEAIYDEDGVWFNQSMEINVSDDGIRPLEEDSNYMEILKMSYSALCLLGKSDNKDEHSEPCFISSKVYPVDYSLNKAEFSQMMNEMKESLSHFNLGIISQKGGSTETMENEVVEEIIDDGIDETFDEVEDAPQTEEVDDSIECEEETNPEEEEEFEDENQEEEFEETEQEVSEPSVNLPTEEEYAQMLAELEELRAYKEEREEADRKDEFDAVLADFDDLAEIDEFKEVVENSMSYSSVDALRNKCYEIRGKNLEMLSFQINASNAVGRVGIKHSTEKVSKYGDFGEKY